MQNPDHDLSITGATGTTHSSTARLDLTALDSFVHFYFREGLATSTQKIYKAERKKIQPILHSAQHTTVSETSGQISEIKVFQTPPIY